MVTERAAKGGKARAAKLTPEQRRESARKAVAARWAKARAGSTVAVTAGVAPKRETIHVSIVMAYHHEPLITTGVDTYSVHSRTSILSVENDSPAREGSRERE